MINLYYARIKYLSVVIPGLPPKNHCNKMILKSSCGLSWHSIDESNQHLRIGQHVCLQEELWEKLTQLNTRGTEPRTIAYKECISNSRFHQVFYSSITLGILQGIKKPISFCVLEDTLGKIRFNKNVK